MASSSTKQQEIYSRSKSLIRVANTRIGRASILWCQKVDNIVVKMSILGMVYDGYVWEGYIGKKSPLELFSKRCILWLTSKDNSFLIYGNGRSARRINPKCYFGRGR